MTRRIGDRGAAALAKAPETSRVVATVLPGQTETLLLRACLLTGAPSRAAWQSLRRLGVNVSDLLTLGGHGTRRLAPLLYRAVKRNRIHADPALLTRCKMAAMREELRAKAFARVVGELFHALDTAAVPFVVLKGTALAEGVYGDPVLRHSHDLELLVPEVDLVRAADVLLGTSCTGTEPLRGSGKLRLYHSSDLPVVLRSRLFEPRLYGGDWKWISSRTVFQRVAGCGVRVLSPADALHHASVHASYGLGRSSLQWAADCYLIIARRGEDGSSGSARRINWQEFLEAVRECRTAIPALAALRYLERELGAPIPTGVLSVLLAAERTASPIEIDIALRGLWRHKRGEVLATVASGIGWRNRWQILKSIAFPSQDYARYMGNRCSSALSLAVYYLGRACRHTARLLMPVQ